jgi:hypothetical protein
MATNDEKIEEAAGVVNGFNVNFSTSLPYQSGTIYVLPNGSLWPSDDDEGLIEDNPLAGTFHMKVAPRSDDRIMVRYIEG